MRNLADVLQDQPASCRTMNPIVFRDGKPVPPSLTISAGACLVWANKSSGPLGLSFSPSPDERPLRELRILPRSVFAEGSFETLPPRAYARMIADEAGKSGCGKSRRGSYYGVQYYRADKRPVTISYTVSPGGAKGRVVLRPKPRHRAVLSSEVEQARRLRCGRNEVDGRPARCKTMQAVLIGDQTPNPAELRIARRGACVVFGNKGKRTLRIESERCAGCFFSLYLEARTASTAYLGAAARNKETIRYTIEPDGRGPSGGKPRPGANGLIVFEDG